MEAHFQSGAWDRHPLSDIGDNAPERPAAVKVGIATAVLLACLYLAGIPFSPSNLIPALILVAVAAGLWHGNAWSGFGGGLFLVANWMATLIGMARFGTPDTSWISVAAATALIFGIAYLLIRAGRALPESIPSRSRWLWIALAGVAFLLPQVFRTYVIPSGAMEDTLLIGDFVAVGILGAPAPVRGGVIVFRYPVDARQTFVKRCMGVPGDRIRIVNKQLYVNGKMLDEPYVSHKTEYVDAYRDNFPSRPDVRIYAGAQDMLEHHVVSGEVVVPPDSCFALGDNRDASLDSRYWGFVPRSNLIGKPWFIYWSYSAPSEALSGSNNRIDQLASRYRGFFSKTRWDRIFMPVRGYAVH